ncbi:hypothetical protein KFU94_01335 [Chloroflexi bacterium TSY]|nr:hypothetical protein [Chloroflexi bacterium TSY]
MKERGDLIQDADGVWIARPDLNWQELPARVEGAIGERISRLEPALYEILQVASVEGDTFTAEALADVLNIDARTAVQQISRELDKSISL